MLFGFIEIWKNLVEVSKGERYDYIKRKRKFVKSFSGLKWKKSFSF